MKITMLGESGSGKTSFMSGLYEMLVNNTTVGFRILTRKAGNILPDSLDDQEQEDMKLLREMIAEGRLERIAFNPKAPDFPENTRQTTRWVFDLMYQGRKICDIDWIDYRGGLLSLSLVSEKDNPYSEDESNQSLNLLNFIMQSEYIILCVDSSILTRNVHELEARVRALSGVTQMGKYLLRYQASAKTKLNFLVVLTKADAIDEKYKASNYKLLIEVAQRVIGGYLTDCLGRGRNSWKGKMIVASAVGEKNATAKTSPQVGYTIIRHPLPMNVAHVLLYFTFIELSKQKRSLEKAVAGKQAQMERIPAWQAMLDASLGFKVGQQRKRKELDSELDKLKNELVLVEAARAAAVLAIGGNLMDLE